MKNKYIAKKDLKDNKLPIGIVAGAITLVSAGVGVIGTVLHNKTKENTYKEKIKELETENERLEAVLVTLNRSLHQQIGALEDLVDMDEFYGDSDEGFLGEGNTDSDGDKLKALEQYTKGSFEALLEDEDESFYPYYEKDSTIEFE